MTTEFPNGSVNLSATGSTLLCLISHESESVVIRHGYRLNRLAAEMDDVGPTGCRERFTRFMRELEASIQIEREDSISARNLILESIRQSESFQECGRIEIADIHRPQIKNGHPRTRKCRNCGRKSLLSRAAKLATAAMRHLADDMAESPAATLAYRESCCGGCPLRDGSECLECGCELYPNLLNKGKLKWRSESCPSWRWHRHNASCRPLVNPTRNLIFHFYPLIKAEWNWQWHIDQIIEHREKFNGKIAIGIVTGKDLADAERVQNLLTDGGVNVSDWVINPNDKKLAETVTFIDLLKAIEPASANNPNSITLRGHTKGVTHTERGIEQDWARLMWEVCTDIPSVEDALASHIVAGPMMSREPLVKRRTGNFFFAGSFYWFRSDVFSRDWQSYVKDRWWSEYWPGQVAKVEEAVCLCHDFTIGAVLNPEYWKTNVVPDWEKWKESRIGEQKQQVVKIKSKPSINAKTPVFINVRNRYTMTRQLVEQIAGLPNTLPIIIDNASTWGPLIDWYESTACKWDVVRLSENIGKYAPWKSGKVPFGDEFIKRYGTRHYVVTDCDLDLSECPDDLLAVLAEPFRWNAGVVKSGLSLRIDNLPDWQHEAKSWEEQFWKSPLADGRFYEAAIDTTFAMYDCVSRPNEVMSTGSVCVRSAPPYCARHLPWYLDAENLDAENRYYFSTIENSASWKPQESSGKALTARVV